MWRPLEGSFCCDNQNIGGGGFLFFCLFVCHLVQVTYIKFDLVLC